MRARNRYRLLLVLVIVLSSVNFFGSLFVFLKLRKPVVHNIRIEQPQPVDPILLAALTNNPQRVSFPDFSTNVVARSPAVSLVSVPRSLGRFRWSYSIVQGREFANLNGRYLSSGSRTAWGIVVDIFPERIIFSSGDYIENANTQEGVPNVLPAID